MKIPFTYYLHDDYQSDERLQILREQDSRFTQELVEKMGEPFYEIALRCGVDTETGEVTILEASF